MNSESPGMKRRAITNALLKNLVAGNAPFSPTSDTNSNKTTNSTQTSKTIVATLSSSATLSESQMTTLQMILASWGVSPTSQGAWSNFAVPKHKNTVSARGGTWSECKTMKIDNKWHTSYYKSHTGPRITYSDEQKSAVTHSEKFNHELNFVQKRSTFCKRRTMLFFIIWLPPLTMTLSIMSNDIPTKIESFGVSTKSNDTASTGSISALTGSLSSSSGNVRRNKPKRSRWNQPHKPPVSASRETFKGVIDKLSGKVFTVGLDQAARYDDTLKALIGYLSTTHDHRVKSCIQHKEKSAGVKILVRPTAPKKTDPADASKEILDKDGEEWVVYQLELKKYIDHKSKLDDDLQQIFNVIIGQCSPGMEQAFAGVMDFATTKEEDDSIKLLKTIEQICYTYQPYEYPLLRVWKALDKLGKSIQPENVLKADHYETVKTTVVVCKASGVNFSLMCTYTVDMAMEELYNDRLITQSEKYSDGVYFQLNTDEKKLVNRQSRGNLYCHSTAVTSIRQEFFCEQAGTKKRFGEGKGQLPTHSSRGINISSTPQSSWKPRESYDTTGEETPDRDCICY